MGLELAIEFIDLCIDNYKNGGHSTTKEQEHRYYKLKHQFQDDHEKARKYDEIKDGTLGFIRAFNWLDKNKSMFLPTPNTPEPETPQPRKDKNQKLRELIEKKMELASPYKDSQLMNGYLYRELRQLLKESKK